MPTSPWLVHHPALCSRLRLYCFSYAGGSAGVFMPWRSLLDADVDLCAIQLPGRGSRLKEPAVQALPELVQKLAQQIANQPGGPFAFFGHSLGALLAFEVTRFLVRYQLARPVHLFVSGTSAPQRRSKVPRLHELDDQAMTTALAKYNGTPPEVLQHRELMELVAPAIRADFGLAADYVYHAGPPLDMPITVFDPDVSAEQAEAWRLETRGPCEIHWLDGDHFFLNGSRDALLAHINAELHARHLSHNERPEAAR